jgi:hypothetical protein
MILVRTLPVVDIYQPHMSSQFWTFMFFTVLLIACICLNMPVYRISVANHLEYFGVTLHADYRFSFSVSLCLYCLWILLQIVELSPLHTLIGAYKLQHGNSWNLFAHKHPIECPQTRMGLPVADGNNGRWWEQAQDESIFFLSALWFLLSL